MGKSNAFEQFGVHLMVDGYGASREILKNRELLTKILHDIPVEMGMHLISDPVVIEVGPKNRKDPGGLSGFVLIAESHFSFHTFPDRGFITLDIYTCQNSLDTSRFIERFKDVFKLSYADSYVQPRGISYPSENFYM